MLFIKKIKEALGFRATGRKIICADDMVAGADSHTAFSINEEFNFTGPHGVSDATPKARLSGAAVSTGPPAIDLATAGAEEQERAITITAGEINWLTDTWQKRWNRPPTPKERAGIIDQHLIICGIAVMVVFFKAR